MGSLQMLQLNELRAVKCSRDGSVQSQEEQRCLDMLKHSETESELESEEKQRLRDAVHRLEDTLCAVKTALREQKDALAQSAIEFRGERRALLLRVRDLEERLSAERANVRALERASSLEGKRSAKVSALREMERAQTERKYAQLRGRHCANLDATDEFLEKMNARCRVFMRKYQGGDEGGDEEEEEGDLVSEGSQSVSSSVGGLRRTRNVEGRLTRTLANLEQFLHDVAMLMLDRETGQDFMLREEDEVEEEDDDLVSDLGSEIEIEMDGDKDSLVLAID